MKGETPSVTKQRARRERILEKVGIGTIEGQKLLEKWGREAMIGRRSVNQQESGGAT